MKLYIPITVFLYVVVNFLLLTGTGKMLRRPVGWVRCLLGAAISGFYVLLCLAVHTAYIKSFPLYLLSVVVTALVTYGFDRNGLISCASFSFLYIALGGISVENRGLISLFLGTIGVFLVTCIMPAADTDNLVQVELFHQGKAYRIRALRDTGNSLKDPLTGRPVLILGADIAETLTGLTSAQLRTPVESLGLIPGLRLIPYKTVGQAGLFLLAMRVNTIKIGSWKGSAVVAFSPERLSAQGTYQALTGGFV